MYHNFKSSAEGTVKNILFSVMLILVLSCSLSNNLDRTIDFRCQSSCLILFRLLLRFWQIYNRCANLFRHVCFYVCERLYLYLYNSVCRCMCMLRMYSQLVTIEAFVSWCNFDLRRQKEIFYFYFILPETQASTILLFGSIYFGCTRW